MNFPINKDQLSIANKIIKEWSNNEKQVLAWYTGSGKTNVFLYIIYLLLKKNPNLKIGVSCYLQRTIKKQTAERASLFFDKFQMLSSKRDEYIDTNVYFFNPQGIFKRENHFPFKFDYLIIDESHIGTNNHSKMFPMICDNFLKPGAKILGCSATPWNSLNNKLLKGSVVHRRGLDSGYLFDGRINNFNIFIERFSVKTKKEDYSKDGDISEKFIRNNFNLIHKSCLTKTEHILRSKNKHLGEKCLIIAPKGEYCKIAKDIAKQIGDSAICLVDLSEENASDKIREHHEEKTISEFKNNPKIKFLVVVNKCQIGFDMPELSSTIDLTMTRNIGLIVQRWGRLARKNKQDLIKNYFYVVDDTMTVSESEWMIGTSIDYAIGNWEVSKNKRSVFFRSTPLFDSANGKKEFSVSFVDLADKYTNQRHLSTKSYSMFNPENKGLEPGSWGLEKLIAACKEYESRTDLSKNNRYVYKKMMKFHKAELDKIFPYKKKTWSAEECLRLAKKYKSIARFKAAYPSAHWHLVYKDKKEEMKKAIYGDAAK